MVKNFSEFPLLSWWNFLGDAKFASFQQIQPSESHFSYQEDNPDSGLIADILASGVLISVTIFGNSFLN